MGVEWVFRSHLRVCSLSGKIFYYSCSKLSKQKITWDSHNIVDAVGKCESPSCFFFFFLKISLFTIKRLTWLDQCSCKEEL